MPALKHETRTFQCVAVVMPGDTVPGTWVAHCLTFDVLAQANDPDTAVRLVANAAALAIADDLSEGLDPDERKAPADEWRVLDAALRGSEITMEEALRTPVAGDGRVAVMVASFVLAFERRHIAANPTIFPTIGRTIDRSAVAAVC